jgi:hypothetical protein
MLSNHNSIKNHKGVFTTMKILQRTIAGMTLTGLAGILASCGNETSSTPSTSAMVISTDQHGQKVTEKYTDVNQDGEVDFYIIGPTDRKNNDATIIDARPEEGSKVRAYASLAQATAFEKEHPGKKWD